MHDRPGTFSYPFDQARSDLWNVPLTIRFANLFRPLLPVRLPKRIDGIKIYPFEDRIYPDLSGDDFPLIFVVHNGKRYLRSFLKHYRELGVTRFLCVDDQSTDGTAEYLADQPDVDLHTSNVRYKDAHRSKAWRELLAEKYGKNRWYLNVDVDEYLFTGTESKENISQYAKRLEAKGIRRLPAPMLDMVTGGKLSEAEFEGNDDTMPWNVSSYFDGAGYHGFVSQNAINLRGGPRLRLFEADAELMKYPLIYWDNNTSMGVSIHAPKPGHLNHAPVCGCLLHFKMFSDVEQMATYATRDKQYFDGAREYQRMLEYFSENAEKSLLNSSSVEFTGSAELAQRGFIVPPN